MLWKYPTIQSLFFLFQKEIIPYALDITLIVYHPDLLHSNKPESLRTKFFLNKMSQPSLCGGGGAPNNDPASSASPWIPWSFHIPEFSLWHSRGVSLWLHAKSQRKPVGNDATERNLTLCHKICRQSWLCPGLPLFTKWLSVSSSANVSASLPCMAWGRIQGVLANGFP